ncbi:IPT/TIG domain-containing protein [Flavobacterium sp. PLA-1-15]|uniref:IPT/TIG domain-containing protein n=1 Tax=Flavobacterium sp. PLA-1-15 TaxID=3380533 RepID=UPI003B816E48
MKNLKKISIGSLLIIVLSFFSLSSCSEDDSSTSGVPVITSVTATVDEDGNPSDLEPITMGYADNMYIIRGSGLATVQKIYFNEKDTYFNPTLVTDTEIFVVIDRDTPYADATDQLKVVTQKGTAVFDFIVAPPAPGFHSFNPINATDGQEITIYGSFFLDPIVKVGDVEAVVVSSTLTQIKAILPAGSQLKKVSVTTISGTAIYNTAVGTAIFDDAFYAPWGIPAWNNHEFITDGTKSNQGLVFIKKAMDGWGNIQGDWAWNDQLSSYTGIKFAIKSDAPGKLKLVFNGAWDGEGVAERIFETTTGWKEFTFTWAQLGNPAALQNISFQEFSGNANVYYIDNITYTVD